MLGSQRFTTKFSGAHKYCSGKLAIILDNVLGWHRLELQLLLEQGGAKLILDVPHVPQLQVQGVVLGIMLDRFNSLVTRRSRNWKTIPEDLVRSRRWQLVDPELRLLVSLAGLVNMLGHITAGSGC